MIEVAFDATPLFAHVAGTPVEETLPGLLACGAVGMRVVTVYVRRRLGGRGRRRAQPGQGSRGRAG